MSPNGQVAPACRKLAPWEEMGYFDDPIFQSFKITASGQVLTPITADPHRVILIVGSNSQIALTLDPTGLYGGGIYVGSGGGTIELREHDHGPLPMMQWYVITVNAMNFWVLQVRLREFPECDR